MKLRFIPSLLIENRLAYVSSRFEETSYVGDPFIILNTLSSYAVDEVLLVDIGAGRRQSIDVSFLKSVRTIADFPVSYAGGIRTNNHIDDVFSSGIDKIFLSASNENLSSLASYGSSAYGKQSIGLSVDYVRRLTEFYLYCPYVRQASNESVFQLFSRLNQFDFSDIILTDVESTGTSSGINLDILRVTHHHNFHNPIILSGGLSYYDSRQFELPRLNYPSLSGISAASSVFLQDMSFGSTLISYLRHQKYS